MIFSATVTAAAKPHYPTGSAGLPEAGRIPAAFSVEHGRNADSEENLDEEVALGRMY
jgi:hypothetical protein